jgi:hypothetical protein
MSDFYPDMSNEPETRDVTVKFVGGSTAVTKLFGSGVTVTYVSTGIVDLTFGSHMDQFTYVGVTGWCFGATTASQVKGYTMVPGDFNTSTRKLRLNMTGASESLTDLSSSQTLTLRVMFKATGATG